MKDSSMIPFLERLYYLTTALIGIALISSFFIIIHCVRNSNIHVFNTWQFPMLLALFFDSMIVIIKHGK